MIFKSTLLASSLLFLSAHASATEQNDPLALYCNQDGVEFEHSVTVKPGVIVANHQGSFYQVVTPSETTPAMDWLSDELKQIGLSLNCSEYLLTNSSIEFAGDSEVIARVYFNFDDSTLTSQSEYVLTRVMRLIEKRSPNLELSGHTDNVGDAGYNFSLGLKRSKSVEKYLVDRGVQPNLITTTSYGETKPFVDNMSDENRQLNRRVEVSTL
ncbi:OmpA family protein [Vibrio atypicus]|uniref:OmpA family protein n=1 Tax=Vibrio atypicus TaxID=558271 RepID=UPI001359A082|nr:OmpA family protein [Vibrio atypicus]